MQIFALTAVVFAASASAAAATASTTAAGAVTSDVAPPSSPPPGCSGDYDGSFEIGPINVTSSSSKRGLSSRDTKLSITLSGGVLMDTVGRTGYIASNYQFQFDDPPQAGAIWTGGFSVCPNASLALGSDVFWFKCLSGTFYNLYSKNQGGQCIESYIQAYPVDGGHPGTANTTSSATSSSSSTSSSSVSASSSITAASNSTTSHLTHTRNGTMISSATVVHTRTPKHTNTAVTTKSKATTKSTGTTTASSSSSSTSATSSAGAVSGRAAGEAMFGLVGGLFALAMI